MVKTIDKEKVYYYLGYDKIKHKIDEKISTLVDNCIQEVLDCSEQNVTATYDIDIVRRENKIFINDILLDGNDIVAHLENCTKVVVMAATLGVKIDALIRKTELLDMTKAVVMDAVSNVLIEAVCDEFEENLRAESTKKGEYLTIRFSPGYGDLPLEVQNDLLVLTDSARRIGLTLTSSNLLVPRKSVTAIMGLSQIKVVGKRASCKNCKLNKKCIFLKRGITCE